MAKLIVWLTIEDKADAKKYKFNQFWVEASNNKEAFDSAKEEAIKLNFIIKILGVSKYENISHELRAYTKKTGDDLFRNKTFH